MFRYLRSLTPSDEAAEDALQEVYVGVFRAAKGFKGDSTPRVWLYGIARRQAARSFRRRAGEPVSAVALEDLSQTELACAAGFGGEADPEQITSAIEDRALLQHALSQLSESDREVILLRDIEGLSGPETALLLGEDLAAIKTRLHRARLRLLAHIGRGGGDHGQ